MVDLKPMSSRVSIHPSISAYLISEAKGSNVPKEHEDDSSNPGTDDSDDLQKGLKSRHILLIALGGAIGTGLFVGSGLALYTCGPAALFLSYVIMSLVVWFVMNMMAEMATFLPVPGTGAPQFITDYLDPSLGFAMGYNYWYGFTLLVPAEVVAAAIIIQYWTTDVHIAVWITVFLMLAVLVNVFPVKAFGEVEFYFAGIKLVAITGLIILGIVLFFGGGPTHDRLGFRYWKDDNAFHQHLVDGNTGKFLAVWTAIIKAGYSFIMSPELIVACTGETQNPRRALPKCANLFIYRLSFCYILGSLVIGIIADSRSTRLILGSDASASPFVLGIQNASIPALNHIINAVVLTSAASAGNSFFYASTRTLYSLSRKGLAPKIFSSVNRWGTPYYCVALTFVVSCLSYLNVSSSSSQVFTWFTNLTTISCFISWICVSWAFTRWRRAIVVQGLKHRVTYTTRFQPYGAYFVMLFIGAITITNGYGVFFNFYIADFIAAYITFPFVFCLYFGHRAYSKYSLGRKRWLTPLEEFDFTKLEQIEHEHSQFVEPEKKNLWGNLKFFKSPV